MNMKSRPGLTVIYNMLDQDECQCMVGSTTKLFSNHAAFQVHNVPTAYQNQILLSHFCFHKPKCSHCSRIGHTVDKCYKDDGYRHGMLKGKKQWYLDTTNLDATNCVNKNQQEKNEELACESISKEKIHTMISYLSSQLHTSSVTPTI